LELNLEVSDCFELEEQNTLSFVGTLTMQELRWKLKKSMVAIIQK